MAESLKDLIARCPPRRSSPVQSEKDAYESQPSSVESPRSPLADSDNDLILRTPSPTPSEAFAPESPRPLELSPAPVPLVPSKDRENRVPLSAPAPAPSRTPRVPLSVSVSTSHRIPRLPLSAPSKPTLTERITAHEVFLRHKEAADRRLANQRRTQAISIPVQTRIDRTVASRRRSRKKVQQFYDCAACGIVCPGRTQYEQHLLSRRHRRIAAGETKFTCTLCDNKIFYSKEDYQRHIQGRKHREAKIATNLTK